MTLWPDLETLALADAERHNLAIRHFGRPRAVRVGTRRFTLEFEPCRARYPLLLSGVAAQAPFSAACDAGALLPELTPAVIGARGDTAADARRRRVERLVVRARRPVRLHDRTHRRRFRRRPAERAPTASPSRMWRVAARPISRFAAPRSMHGCDGTCRAPPSGDGAAAPPVRPHADLRRRPVDVRCRACARSRWATRCCSTVDSCYLRVPLRLGACRILLKFTEEHTLIDHVLNDETPPVEVTSELLPIDALTFAFDAVLGTLSLSVAELAHLRQGSIVAFRLPARERTRHAAVPGHSVCARRADRYRRFARRARHPADPRGSAGMIAQLDQLQVIGVFFMLGLLPLAVDDDDLVHEVQHRAHAAALGARRAAGAEQPGDLGDRARGDAGRDGADAREDRRRAACRRQRRSRVAASRRAVCRRCAVRSANSCWRIRGPTNGKFLVGAAKRIDPERDAHETDLQLLIPAFLISEISSGFEAGFLLYIAFLVVDLVVANVLTAMGMVMLSPSTVSIPLKLFVFVSVSGMSKLMHGLIVGYVK